MLPIFMELCLRTIIFIQSEGADVAMEVVGTGSAFGEGLLYLRPGGRYLEVGNVSMTHNCLGTLRTKNCRKSGDRTLN